MSLRGLPEIFTVKYLAATKQLNKLYQNIKKTPTVNSKTAKQNSMKLALNYTVYSGKTSLLV